MKPFLKKHGQLLINIYVFLCLGGWAVWHTRAAWSRNEFGWVEAGFTLQNMVMLTLILIRRKHRMIESRWLSQTVAILAFYSGLAFMGQAPTGGQTIRIISLIITVAANILGIMCLLNLGRSFGILIAVRKVKTRGLYSFVRHPMYGTDILLRIGFMISHCNWFTLTVFSASIACYLYRAVLEERFLKQEEEYALYMQKVRFRFIPGIF